MYLPIVDRNGSSNESLKGRKVLRILMHSSEKIMKEMKPKKPEPFDGQGDELKVNTCLYKMGVYCSF